MCAPVILNLGGIVHAQPDAKPAWLQGLEMKRQLHRSDEEQYNTEKQKYTTVQQLNSARIVKELNGGRASMPYRNLRMG